jgi:IS30 family transposase
MKHLWLEERIEISTRLRIGETQTIIAKALWYTQWSISKEIKRGSMGWLYDPIYANNKSLETRKETNIWRTKLLQWNIWAIIESKLHNKDEDWSPDTIIGRMKAEWCSMWENCI